MMRTIPEFYAGLKGIIDEGLQKQAEILESVRADENALATIKANDPRGRDHKTNVDEARMHVQRLAGDYKDKVQAYCKKYMDELEKSEALNPEDLTEDAKFLHDGIPLKKADLEAMIERNLTNDTMLRLIADYCQKHNVADINMHYLGSKGIRKVIESVPEVAGTVFRHHDKPSVTKQLMDSIQESLEAVSKE